jgi:Family of unknown function (DUF6515)
MWTATTGTGRLARCLAGCAAVVIALAAPQLALARDHGAGGGHDRGSYGSHQGSRGGHDSYAAQPGRGSAELRSQGNRSINGLTAKQYTTQRSNDRSSSTAASSGLRAVNSNARGRNNSGATTDHYNGHTSGGRDHPQYPGQSGGGRDYHYDGRHASHSPGYNHYYPASYGRYGHYAYGGHPAYYAPRVIHRPVSYYHPIYVGGAPYYYYGGYYYRPYYDNFWISVTAPIGAHVGVLPAGYVSFGYGGYNYFHVNATYYLYDQPSRQYVVVEPPPGGAPGEVASGGGYAGYEGTSEEIFVYPAQGQSAEQTDRDRYECHMWAVSQTGVDPSTGDTDDRERADYRRALTACLDGRGYTVR